MKTIVVSGVTLRKGGTLAILRDALAYLSELAAHGEYRVVALVHKRELCDYPNIEYLEMPHIVGGWLKRLWCEYVTMHRISKELVPIYLWLSMHDVTPRVEAKYQAVYCQTSFPFYKWKWRDFRFDPKIPLFALFTRLYYKANVQSNKYLIVQQEWLREGLSKMLNVPESKFIVAPPQRKVTDVIPVPIKKNGYTYLYVSTADCHKNFETLCRAAELLEQEIGKNKFKVVLTLKGNENKYAQWLYSQWGNIDSICFHGLMNKETLYGHYKAADCLVFPSNIETWGLPISEFMEVNDGPMILSDLAYAHNTAQGGERVAFFKQDDAKDLKEKMRKAFEGDFKEFEAIPKKELKEPKAESWDELFSLLL
mgnify:CR=1 FL=1